MNISKLKQVLKESLKIAEGNDFLMDGFIAVPATAEVKAVFTAAAEKKHLKINELNYKIDRFLNRDAEILTTEPRCKDDFVYFIQNDKIYCIKRNLFEVFKPNDFEKIEIKTNNYIFEFWDNSEYIPVFVGLAMGSRVPQGVTVDDVKNFPFLSEVEEAEKRERREKREAAKNNPKMSKGEFYINTDEGNKTGVFPKEKGYKYAVNVNGETLTFGIKTERYRTCTEWNISELSTGFRCFTCYGRTAVIEWIEQNKEKVLTAVEKQKNNEKVLKFREFLKTVEKGA